MQDIKKDYWKYYVQIEYDSPVYKLVEEDGKEKRINKCCYPIKLIDWDKYNEIAYPILAISKTYLTRRLEIDEDKASVFDFVVLGLIQDNRISQMEKMFSMAFREDIHAMAYRKGEDIEVRFVFDSDNDFFIDRRNYEDVRQILMAQSFYFDPIIGKNEKSQALIDKAIQRYIKNNSSEEFNMESQIALVRSEFGERDWNNYTYYELRIDYYTIMRKENYRAIHVYKVMGSKAKIPELGAISEAHSNPIGEDVMFKKNNRNEDKM